MKFFIPALFSLAAMVMASSAMAQSKESKDEEATSQAAMLYKQGAEEYLRGNYVDALALFRKGNDLKPNGMFLYNISLVYGKLENYSEALSYAERADEDGIPPEAWARNMPRILAYRMTLQSRELIDARGQCASDSDCDEGLMCGPEKSCIATPEEALSVSRGEPSSKPTWLGWTGIGLTAGGAALLSMALLKDSEVGDLVESYDRLRVGSDVEGARAKKQEVEDAQSQGQIFLYAGAGLAAVGLGIFIYDLVRDTEPAVSLIPSVHEDGVGVWATGRF